MTEKPLQSLDLSLPQADESSFVDSPFKVYVGNLARNVTSEVLAGFFSDRGKVLSAKVSRAPGTSKSSGFGFVTFSSEEDVEAAIVSANNAVSASSLPPSLPPSSLRPCSALSSAVERWLLSVLGGAADPRQQGVGLRDQEPEAGTDGFEQSPLWILQPVDLFFLFSFLL